jgi:hypothetical protein
MRFVQSAVAAMLLAVSACSGTPSVKDAEKSVATFHQRVDNGDYEAVWRDSSELLTKAESKEKLVGLLTAIHDQFGKVKAAKQNGWKVNYDNGVSTTEVNMTTTYEKGVLNERFVFENVDKAQKLLTYEFKQE